MTYLKMVKKFCVQNGKVERGKSISFINEKERDLLLCIRENPEGLRVTTIKKLTNLPTRTIYNILEKYSEKKILENIYPLWKPVNGLSDFWQTLSRGNNIFELHNPSYVLKLMKTPDWWKTRKARLMKLRGWEFSNHNFGKNNSNPFQQIINESYIIQTYSQSIIIIHRKDYFSENPYELAIQEIEKTIELINFLEERFRFKFFPEGIPNVEIRTNHFNRLKDYLAEKCKSDGRRFLVKTKVGDVWVDYSEPFGKEASTPDLQDTLERVTKDHAENKPKLNSELQADIESLRTELLIAQKESLQNDKNISESGMDLRLVVRQQQDNIIQMQSEVRGLTELVSQLAFIIRNMKDK